MGLCLTEYELPAPVAGELRFAFFADLHSRDFGERLPELLEEVDPAFIAVGGDSLSRWDGARELAYCVKLFERLGKIAPVYFSLGNHEQWRRNHHGDGFLKELESSGAVLLHKSYVDIAPRGVPLRLGGMVEPQMGKAGDLPAFLTEFEHTERCRILLAHRPEGFAPDGLWENCKAELVLSGHAHGGLWRPFGIGIYAPGQGLLPRRCYGLYGSQLITSGLFGSLYIPRLWNPPELCSITLLPNGGSSRK